MSYSYPLSHLRTKSHNDRADNKPPALHPPHRQRTRRTTRLHLLLHILLERPHDITGREILTHEIPPRCPTLPITPRGSTPYIRRRFPYHLGEMRRLFTELRILKIILLPLIAPSFDRSGGVGVPGREVLTDGTAGLGVREFAGLGVQGGGGGEGGVPG